LDQTRFRALLRWVVTVPLIATLILAGAALLAAYDLNASMIWVDHTDEVIGQSQRLLKLFVDMETGERGYLITGDEMFLKPYQEASKVLDSEYRKLFLMVKDNPVQQARLGTMHGNLVQWQDYAAHMLALRRAGGAYSDLSINLAGKEEMDEIRNQLVDFQSVEEHLRDQRNRTSQRDWYIELTTCIVLGLGVGSGLAIFTVGRMRDIAASFADTGHALAESERRWITTLASIGDAVVATGPDGLVTFLNPVAATLTGWELEDALGQPIQNVFHLVNEKTRAPIDDIVSRVLKGGLALEPEHMALVTRDGRTILISESVAPILEEDGAIVGVALVFRDITERRLAEELLRQNRLQLGVALRAAHSGDFVWNIKTNEVTWGEEGMALFGVKREEFRGRYEDWYERLIPEDGAAVVDAVERSVQSGELETEYRVLRKDDGEVRWIGTRGTVIRDETGAPQRMVGINMDITERKEMEQALRANAQRLDGIVQSAMDAIVSVDEQQRIVLFNHAAELVFKCSSLEVLGMPLDQFIPAQYREAHREHLQNFASSERTNRSMFSLGVLAGLRSDGEQFPIEATISQMTMDGRKLFTVILRDISERKRAEEALRRQAALIDLTPDVFMVRLLDGTFTYWNRGAEALYGWSKSEAVGQRSHNLFQTHYPQDPKEIDEQLRRTGSWSGELIHRTKDGRTIVVQSRWLAQFDALGEVAEVLESNADITARKQAEQQFRDLNLELEDRVHGRTAELEAALADRFESEQRFVTLANFVPQLVWICTADGSNVYFNRRWVEYTGLTLEESYGKAWNTPFHPDDGQAARDAWNRATRTGETYRVKSRLRAADGSYRWFLMLGEALRDGEGDIIQWFGTCTDIADMKQAEDALRESQRGLEDANKELQSFSYSVSHDLRGPLRTMDGFSQALLEDHSQQLDEKGKHYVVRIRKAAQRMGLLIDDLLQLSRLTRVEMRAKRIDFSAMALTLIGELRDSEPGRDVEVRIEPGLETVGDPGLLQIALQNLLSNAWKYTSRREHALIEFGTVHDQSDSAFFVRDNGAGFDMQYAGHLFSPFQRLHAEEEFKGTGIGLATVQRIIRRHSGRIWAEAAVGQGATFYFQLAFCATEMSESI